MDPAVSLPAPEADAEPLPEPYGRWLAEAFGAPPPRECTLLSSSNSDRLLIRGAGSRQPIEVPRLLLDILPVLASGPLTETRAALERDRNVRVSPALVRKLLDYGVLGPAPRA